MEALNNKSCHTRENACRELIESKIFMEKWSKKILKKMVEKLEDNSELVRCAAAGSLNILAANDKIDFITKNVYVIPRLVHIMMKDKYHSCRETAARALDQLQWQPSDDPKKVYYKLQKEDYKALSSLGEVWYLLQKKDYKALSSLGAIALDNFVAFWENEDLNYMLCQLPYSPDSLKPKDKVKFDFRRDIVHALCFMNGRESFDILHKLGLKSENKYIRGETLRVLRMEKQNLESVDHIVKLYHSEPDAANRYEVALALAKLKSPKSIVTLIEMLQDGGSFDGWDHTGPTEGPKRFYVYEAAIACLKHLVGKDYEHRKEWQEWWEQNKNE